MSRGNAGPELRGHSTDCHFTLADERDGIVAVLEASGELDMAAAPGLRERLNAAIDDGCTSIVVDLSQVTFIDSLSMATIVRARTRLGDQGRLALVASHPYVLLIVQAGGLGSVLELFESRHEALAYAHA